MDPVLELRTAMVTQMRAFSGLTDLVGRGIYDEPPQITEGTGRPKLPYVSLGPSTYDPELVTCVEGGEIMVQVDAWSNEPGQVQVSKVADQIRRCFRAADPALSANALVTFQHWRTDLITDGAFKHASIRFAAIVEEP